MPAKVTPAPAARPPLLVPAQPSGLRLHDQRHLRPMSRLTRDLSPGTYVLKPHTVSPITVSPITKVSTPNDDMPRQH
jgi:hypothetical protein